MSTADAQTSLPPVLHPDTARVWVHPSDGFDPVDATQAPLYVNDSSRKFRTLGAAIRVAYDHLVQNYHATNNPEQYAVVYALPGTYSPSTNGEVFPVEMRDRVHVQGVGARRCVIRGESTNVAAVTNRALLLPTAPSAPTPAQSVERLIDYTQAVPAALVPGTVTPSPWYPSSGVNFYYDDTPEVLDGFTVQGGDVQVLLTNGITQSNDYFSAARISNCVMDLRHRIPLSADGGTTLNGPYIGILMSRRATYDSSMQSNVGYLDSRVLIAHNTFVFGRWNGSDPKVSLALWDAESRAEAVGVIDVTENCSLTADPQSLHRGVGSPCLVANVFRTRGLCPPSVMSCLNNPPIPAVLPFAMLGIGNEDTRALLNGVPIQTNAFDPARVGASNGYFYSLPVQSSQVSAPASPWPIWNCHSTPAGPPCGSQTSSFPTVSPPTQPAAHIWDGVNGVDPGFVGEYLATTITGLDEYVDWRILPGSPLENASFVPPPVPRAYFTQPHASDPQWLYAVNVPEDLFLFAWDGEHWGNGRVMDGAPDIGFDERGLLIQAGNWANDSTSHNQSGFMHPPGLSGGKPDRYFILPEIAGGLSLTASGRHLRLQDANVAPPAPSAGDGWIHPPGSEAYPTNLAALPVGYRTKYINYASTAWQTLLLTGTSIPPWPPLANVPNQLPLQFIRLLVPDDECPGGVCSHTYFNLQGLIVDGGTSTQALLRSNMIGEYR